MRILFVGPGTLVAPLRACGHEVIDAFGSGLALAAPGKPFDIRPLWARLAPAPEVLLVADVLAVNALPFGVEDLPAVRVYWTIDPHLNAFWQHHYAQLFDLVLLTQRDLVPGFGVEGLAAHWLPWGAEEAYLRVAPRETRYDLAFVGTVDAATRPKRAAAVARLRDRYGLAVFGTTAAERLDAHATARVLAASRIAFNESVLGDLNFRVFEAMAAGAMLLTESIANGLTTLFTPGVHLDVYTPETLDTQVARYLADEPLRARIAATGQAEVRARHTLTVRMQELTRLLAAGVARRPPRARSAFHWGMAAHLTVVRGLADPAVAWPAALEGLRAAVLEQGEAEAALAVGEILAAGERIGPALAALTEARRLDPANLRTWLLAADLEGQRGETTAAAALVREGLRVAPLAPALRDTALAALDAVGPNGSACLLALGDALEALGLPLLPGLTAQPGHAVSRTALDYFTRAVNADPRNHQAAEHAADLLERAGLAEFALPFCEVALRAAPASAAIRERWERCRAKSYQPRLA